VTDFVDNCTIYVGICSSFVYLSSNPFINASRVILQSYNLLPYCLILVWSKLTSVSYSFQELKPSWKYAEFKVALSIPINKFHKNNI